MMREEFESQYRKYLETMELPEILKNKIILRKCLKERQDICTLLVYNKNTDKNYTLKAADSKRGEVLEREMQILQELVQAGIQVFPKPELLIKENGMTYYLREYVEGETLLSIIKRRGCMPERVLALTGIQLCDLLELLHKQQPPVIHRDIKPENIVYTGKHTFTLIDFETARKYSGKKSRDTVIMGSRPTAAPEQFGFSQTDCRTDIYGLGMTLLFLAVGTYEQKDLKAAGISGRLRRIILKATAFDPGKRYHTVGHLRKDLMKCTNRKLKPQGNRQQLQNLLEKIH